jgi:hypothetical protein
VTGIPVQAQVRRRNGQGPSERRAQGERCWRMCNRGLTVYEITTVEGISEKTVYRRIDEALNARLVPTVDEYRKQQNDYLDDLEARHEQAITACEALMSQLRSESKVDPRSDRSSCAGTRREIAYC